MIIVMSNNKRVSVMAYSNFSTVVHRYPRPRRHIGASSGDAMSVQSGRFRLSFSVKACRSIDRWRKM